MKPLLRPTGVSRSACPLSGDHPQSDSSDGLLPVLRTTDATARGAAKW